MPETSFGQRLRQARVAAGFSQSDLERISGIPKTTLSRYENDHILPSIHTLQTIATALDVTEGSLIEENSSRIREHFFALLEERGIKITTTRQAEMIASLVADAVIRREERRA
jgi:transcriptional regulator with XRE-family HTH domain